MKHDSNAVASLEYGYCIRSSERVRIETQVQQLADKIKSDCIRSSERVRIETQVVYGLLDDITLHPLFGAGED